MQTLNLVSCVISHTLDETHFQNGRRRYTWPASRAPSACKRHTIHVTLNTRCKKAVADNLAGQDVLIDVEKDGCAVLRAQT